METKKGNLDFWDRLKYLISNPNFFFEKIKSEQHIGAALLTYIAVAGIVLAIGIGFAFTFYSLIYSGSPFMSYLGAGFTIALSIIMFIFGTIITFLYSAIIHIIVIGFKGQGGYKDSYNAYTYSMIPTILITAIPFVGFFLLIPSLIYSFILMSIGISKLHKISIGKSILACLLPIIALIGLFILFIFTMISLSRVY